MNKNQIGRILLQRLVEETGCDIQTAIRFFYNSDFYTSLEPEPINGDIETMFYILKKEFELG